jgi:hypothetical protein
MCQKQKEGAGSAVNLDGVRPADKGNATQT